ncbi:MAG: 4-hydroxy-3-methylbut-2-enyl diphosphate reductase [Vicinamibacteria bacterium]|nr:4-hydroxy-3-methylbut-2-enyl diphosphate reductase [Vicinamibacteria bacterium]
MEERCFRKGFGLKDVIAPLLAESYGSPIVDRMRALGSRARAGDVTFKLAREFGFCYGVERAVDYAYETHAKFPDRRIFLAGEIIHNPDVNRRLKDLGIILLSDEPRPIARYRDVTREDVVILPAFGVTASEREHLNEIGCVLVDTTCGSVLNVWQNVRRHAREGFTAVIHGKHLHEETRATASQALTRPGSHYLCVKDRDEARSVCSFIRGEMSGAELAARFARVASPGFDPDRDLQRIGLANQTTMLMQESLEIQEMLRGAMRDRWGEAETKSRFRAFDTICSATQDRQDAVRRLIEEGDLDLVVVVGGYNSSNTQALARLSANEAPTYHINGADGIGPDSIRHRPVGAPQEVATTGWLPRGPVVIGLTAGASTPDSVVGQVIERILSLRRIDADRLESIASRPEPASLPPRPFL